MTRYRVLVTATALEAVERHVRFVSDEQHSPRNAERWLQAISDAVGSLETLPRRAKLAEEDAYVTYEVRRLVVYNHLLLFTIDDDRGVVHIIGLRHGQRLPTPEQLPATMDELRDAEE